MLKNISVAIICAIVITSFAFIGSAPVLRGYSHNHVGYLTNSSSAIRTVKLTNSLPVFYAIRGESCSFTATDFDVDGFFNKYGATKVITEQTEFGVSYYAYSPQIKYKERISNTNVNLHVAIYQDRITIGTPIIYGSF